MSYLLDLCASEGRRIRHSFHWHSLNRIGFIFLITVCSTGGWGQSNSSQQSSQATQATQDAQVAQGGEPSTEPRRSTVELIREDQLVGLPLNGRSYNSLATLQSGVSDASSAGGPRGVSGGNLNVSGARSTANSYLLDGTNIQNAGNSAPRSAAGVQLGSDAALQVQVFANTYSAEYGRGSGGVLNSITRSGGDQFHGSLFEFFRNSKLDARNFFDTDVKVPFKRNQFGGLVSGPLMKGKTYFMGSFEAMRDRLTETDRSFVPDAEARQGTITNSDGSFNHSVPVLPIMRRYLDLYPAANGERQGRGIGETIGTGFQPVDENFFVVRLDHQITSRDSGFLRYSFDDATSIVRASLFLFRGLTQSRQQYLTLVESHIFSPSTINSVRFGFTRPVSRTEDVSEVDIPADLNFVPGALQFGLMQVAGLSDYGPNSSQPNSSLTNTFQFADDLVLQRGAHALKTGIDIQRYRWDAFTSDSKWAIWSFNSLDSLIQGGREGTNLTVALPGSVSDTAFRQTLAGFYLQDSYRVSRQLDLDLGLRYEITTMINDNRNRTSALVDAVHDTQPKTGSLMKENPSLTNFSPRIGFTWAPWSQRDTVVSAGFGIFRDQILYYLVDPVKNAVPFHNVAVLTNFDAQDPALSASQHFPNASGIAAGKPLSTKTLDYNNIKLPAVMRYNLTLQHPLGAGWTARASYVGARGNHLLRGFEANLFPAPVRLADSSLCFPPDIAKVQPEDINPSCPPVSSLRAGPVNPAFNSIEVYSTDAQSFYNSLQLNLNKSASRGMSVGASYTFSKSVDDATNIGPGDAQYGFERKLDRALSNFDQRHRFSVNYFLSSPRRLGGPVLGRMFGGWRLGGIVGWRTGSPGTVRLSVRTPGYLFAAIRPNLAPGFSNSPTEGQSAGCAGAAAGEIGTPRRYFDPCAFTLPAPGTLGNLGRNTLINPSSFQLDISLQREFVLGGEKRFQFRMEMFNLPNHPSFGGPPTGSSFVFTGFPAQRNTRIGRITRMSGTPRQIQFGLRLSF